MFLEHCQNNFLFNLKKSYVLLQLNKQISQINLNQIFFQIILQLLGFKNFSILTMYVCTQTSKYNILVFVFIFYIQFPFPYNQINWFPPFFCVLGFQVKIEKCVFIYFIVFNAYYYLYYNYYQTTKYNNLEFFKYQKVENFMFLSLSGEELKILNLIQNFKFLISNFKIVLNGWEIAFSGLKKKLTILSQYQKKLLGCVI
eukprot:TRINITY_DN23201_c0_g1_i1.p2 TRINITY_DN23201_c0_g1~~TRINITY_DN23201_c0_g1_i1.p2  ORF type:complete len:200 (+),score=3.76 TRINITY_DN23201_c0_g1_i1:84-683(+)